MQSRHLFHTFLSAKQLRTKIAQALAITAAGVGIGYYFLKHRQNENVVHTAAFITLLFSNIFLTVVNRSFHHPVFVTLRYKKGLLLFITSVTLSLISALLIIPSRESLFTPEVMPVEYLPGCLAVAFLSTIWFEIFKRDKGKTGSSNFQNPRHR